MASGELSKAIERCLRRTEALCEKYCRDRALPPEEISARATVAFNDSIEALCKIWRRWDATVAAVSIPAKADLCKVWLGAFIETKAISRLLALLEGMAEQGAVATSSTSSVTARRQAVQAVGVAGRMAIMLTKHAQFTACLVSKVSNNAALCAMGDQIMAEITQPGFIKALANAARAVVAVSELLRSATAVWQLDGPTFEVVNFSAANDMLLADTASVVGLYVKGITDALSSLLFGPVTAAGRHKVPNEVTQIVEALVESELFAAAAATLVDIPNAFTSAGLSAIGLQEVCKEMRNGCGSVAGAVAQLGRIRNELAARRGQAGTRLAAGLWRMGQHGAVRRLQLALLDQLAVHAGMGPRLEEAVAQGRAAGQGPEEVVQQQQEAEAEGDGWGTWWFAREEAERGQLLGMETSRGRGRRGSLPERDMREQESYHTEIMGATIGWWYGVEREAEPGAGVPAARPPPLLAARLTARAAAALCRLCRGKGLDGGHGSEPTRMFTLVQPLMGPLLKATGHETPLPAGTAQACLPYWLEAAGWWAAVQCDASALAARHLADYPSMAPDSKQQLAGVFGRHMLLLETLQDVAFHCKHGFSALSPAAQADVRRRLFRCGLAATLDHTLRLAYSAQDRGAEDAASHAAQASVIACNFLEVELLFLLPPTAARGSSRLNQGGGGSSSGGGGGRSSGGDAGGSGGSGGGGSNNIRHQLGLVHTLSKRAAVVNRELEAMCKGPPPSTQALAAGDAGPDFLSEVPPLLLGLNAAVGSLQDRIATGARTPQGAAAQGPSGAEQGASGPEGEGLELARETLALAARAVCDLGAAVAWELARGAAAEAAAVVEAEGKAEEEAEGAIGMAPGVLVSAADARTAEAERVATGAEGDQLEGRAKEDEEGSITTGDVESDDHTEAGDSPPKPRTLRKKAIGDVLYRLIHLCREPSPLCPAQLLACQPHRLLAAACALAAALPNDTGRNKSHLRLCIASIVTILSAREGLSSYMRCWLAPPPGFTGAYSSTDGGSGGGGEEPDACAGCLAAPLHAAMPHAPGHVPTLVVPALVLLRIAQEEVTLPQGASYCAGSGGGGGDGSSGVCGAPDGGFKDCAKATTEFVLRALDDRSVIATQEAVLPDGSKASHLLQEQQVADRRPPPPAPPAALPPPLALPPSLARALPQLRVCSNPRCGNFAGPCEDALPFKQCGGCRAVRYCGKDCQGAHWREAHKSECKALRVEKGHAVA